MDTCEKSSDGNHCTHHLNSHECQCCFCGEVIDIRDTPERRDAILRALHNVSMVQRKRGYTEQDVYKAIADAKAGIEYAKHESSGKSRGVVVPFESQRIQ